MSRALRIICTLSITTLIAATTFRNGHAPAEVTQIDPVWTQRIEQERPQVILLGNSILNEGVDTAAFSTATGCNTLKVWSPGASSAWQYLVIKNVIAPASHRPPVVVLFFRDHFLTEPAFRTQGPYRQEILRFAGPHEPLLERLAFGKTRWSSFEQQREQLKTNTEKRFKQWTGSLFGVELDEVENAIEYIFREEAKIQELVNIQQLDAERSDEHANYDFADAVNRSFLPEMIRLLRESDVQLVLVRMKRRPDRAGNAPHSPELEQYLQDLHRYLDGQGVPLLDFGDEPSLTLQHYGNGDHLNRTSGRRTFLPMLVEAIRPHLPR